MLIRRDGILGQSDSPFGVRLALAKCKERPGVEPEYASIVLVSGQQLLERAVITPLEQASEESVPDPCQTARNFDPRSGVTPEAGCPGSA